MYSASGVPDVFPAGAYHLPCLLVLRPTVDVQRSVELEPRGSWRRSVRDTVRAADRNKDLGTMSRRTGGLRSP